MSSLHHYIVKLFLFIIETSSSESSDGKRRPASVSITYSDAESSHHPWQVSVKMETSDDESELLSFQVRYV